MKELSIEEKAKRNDETLEQLKDFIEGTRENRIVLVEEDIIDIFPELKETEDKRNKTMVVSKSEGLSKGTGGVSGKNVRPLSSMTNIEREEWGLILADELEEDPYSWLVRHNFLEDIEINIGLPKTLNGPNPPIYL